MDPKKLLEEEIDHIKEHVDEHEPEIDELIEHEQQGEEREELLDWLAAKKERLELLNSEEHLQDLLAHIEQAYRTASISMETYLKAKEVNNRLLENN